MNQEKIGKFIAECRKNKKLTQAELAEKLGVTDRSISKWENGRGMPELSLFKPLCDELDITINELMSGEKLNKGNYQQKLEENIIDINKEVIRINRLAFKKALFILAIFFVGVALFIIGAIIFQILYTEYWDKKFYINEDKISFSICNYDDRGILVKLNALDGLTVHADIIDKNNKKDVYYKAYRMRKEIKNNELLNEYSNPFNFFPSYTEKIYYDDKLIWSGEKLNKCEE